MTRRRRAEGRFRALVTDVEAPTMPGLYIDRGAYRGAQRQAEIAEATVAFEVALGCGLLLASRGASTVDVESAVHGTAVALGLDEVVVDITYTSLTLSALVHGRPTSAVRVVRMHSTNYTRLTDGHQLVADVIAGRTDAWEARARLRALETRPRIYARWGKTMAVGLLSGSVAISLGAGVFVAVMAFVTSVMIDRIARRLGRIGLLPFFVYAVGGTIAALVGAAVSLLPIQVRPSLMVAAGIVAMLPGALLVSAVRDALHGFPVTAAARLLEVMVIISGIVVGVVVGLGIAGTMGVDLGGALPPDESGALSLSVRVLSAAVAAGAAALMSYANRRPIIMAALLGAVGFLVTLTIGPYLSPAAELAVAAVVVGLLGSMLAHRIGSLALVLVVPAIVPLLPGLTIYRATLLLAGGSPADGIVTMLDAVTRAAALASGVLLGEFFLDRRLETRARRNAAR